MSAAGYALLSVTSGLLGFLTARRCASPARGSESPSAFTSLHAVAEAATALRSGLTAPAARHAVRRLRPLLGATAVALSSADLSAPDAVLAFDACAGHSRTHLDALADLMSSAFGAGGPHLAPAAGCDAYCRVRVALVVPLMSGGRAAGALAVYGAELSAEAVRAAGEAAALMSGRLELAELDESRRRVLAAETRALAAQISPHFIGNSLATIASLVRTDPEQARDLVADFADFARHTLGSAGEITTFADELRCLDRYLVLERARYGERIVFDVQVDPEVMPVPVPYLCLQPLVENAVRHGLAPRAGRGRVLVVVRDAGTEAHISVFDDGVGMDPGRVPGLLAAAPGSRRGGRGIGIANVDVRLRGLYGDDHGLVIRTAPGWGTTVAFRVPKAPPSITLRS
ncbi:two-component system, LytT family, sensor kinase [Sinosporangium album]|uniref:Two-component system, LytT family, sensor kinase n=1 Tax=Sinosporangium album TaxID=504805 RepID=A0A1G7XJL7_9ACTN|nr:histidine kinase [Sinosporangium album]SDG84367.1 two-component system, LytT family, sensor kinase [Sinosporangium album]